MAEENSYKLLYFPVKAVGEPIRFLLSYGDLKFEDVRLTNEQWKEIKESTPYGQLPILEINNKVVHQSIAICRYLGNVVNLTGANDLENLEIDSIVDTIAEFRSSIANYNKENNDSPNKKVLRDSLLENTLPFFLKRFESNAQLGYMAVGKLTWADLYFVSLLDYCNGVMQMDIISDYPNLIKLRRAVLNIPSIKKWVDQRPASDY